MKFKHAVQSAYAARVGTDYIITRTIKGLRLQKAR